jgi:hypothetical protein
VLERTSRFYACVLMSPYRARSNWESCYIRSRSIASIRRAEHCQPKPAENGPGRSRPFGASLSHSVALSHVAVISSVEYLTLDLLQISWSLVIIRKSIVRS